MPWSAEIQSAGERWVEEGIWVLLELVGLEPVG